MVNQIENINSNLSSNVEQVDVVSIPSWLNQVEVLSLSTEAEARLAKVMFNPDISDADKDRYTIRELFQQKLNSND